jgi:hypothetical protein
MTDINKRDYLVFGHDLVVHPITQRPLECGSGALSVPAQARLHLQDIARERGMDVAHDMLRALNAFEAAGGIVKLPTAPTTPGMHHHLS